MARRPRNVRCGREIMGKSSTTRAKQKNQNIYKHVYKLTIHELKVVFSAFFRENKTHRSAASPEAPKGTNKRLPSTMVWRWQPRTQLSSELKVGEPTADVKLLLQQQLVRAAVVVEHYDGAVLVTVEWLSAEVVEVGDAGSVLLYVVNACGHNHNAILIPRRSSLIAGLGVFIHHIDRLQGYTQEYL